MKINPKHRKAAEILVANPDIKIEDLAKEMGVDPSTIWRWRQDKDFKELEHELCKERFGDLEKLAIFKLKENARNGNEKAIEYILDYLGYKPTQKIEADLSTDIVINID